MALSGSVAPAAQDYCIEAILENRPLPVGYNVTKILECTKIHYCAAKSFIRPKSPLEDVKSNKLTRLEEIAEPPPKLWSWNYYNGTSHHNASDLEPITLRKLQQMFESHQVLVPSRRLRKLVATVHPGHP
jgi:hypothetical protein